MHSLPLMHCSVKSLVNILFQLSGFFFSFGTGKNVCICVSENITYIVCTYTDNTIQVQARHPLNSITHTYSLSVSFFLSLSHAQARAYTHKVYSNSTVKICMNTSSWLNSLLSESPLPLSLSSVSPLQRKGIFKAHHSKDRGGKQLRHRGRQGRRWRYQLNYRRSRLVQDCARAQSAPNILISRLHSVVPAASGGERGGDTRVRGGRELGGHSSHCPFYKLSL